MEKVEVAYFINLISLDNGYGPSKTVEQVRRLIEQEQALLLFNNTVIQKYVNAQRAPSSAASSLGSHRLRS
jgi:branched-chain amino acid transport system substrate-binding protein